MQPDTCYPTHALPALAGRHDDENLISLTRRAVNTPHPAMKAESGVAKNGRYVRHEERSKNTKCQSALTFVRWCPGVPLAPALRFPDRPGASRSNLPSTLHLLLMGAVLVGIRMFLHPARKRLTERRKEEFPFGIKRRCGGDKADRRVNLPGVFSHRLDPRSKRVLLQQALQGVPPRGSADELPLLRIAGP